MVKKWFLCIRWDFYDVVRIEVYLEPALMYRYSACICVTLDRRTFKSQRGSVEYGMRYTFSGVSVRGRDEI